MLFYGASLNPKPCALLKHLFGPSVTQLHDKNPRVVERQDLAHLIKDVGQFDDMHGDSAYNLSCMSIMQDVTADRDERYEKTEKRQVYGGEILEDDRFPGGSSEYSHALPQPLTHLNYDSCCVAVVY